MNTNLILANLILACLTACASSKPYPINDFTNTMKTVAESESEQNKEKKEKPPEPQTRCSISNGAGRVFYATDESRDAAETIARHECEIYSRNCVLLDCSPTP